MSAERDNNLSPAEQFKLLEEALLQKLEVIIQATTIEYQAGFDPIFREAISNGYTTHVLPDHQTIFDGIPTAQVTEQLIEKSDGKLIGLAMPIAASLPSGHQGLLLKKAYEVQNYQAEKRGLHIVPTVRQKDIDLYGMESNHFTFIKTMMAYLEQGMGVAQFAEATVEAGRRKNGGEEINGMGYFDPTAIEVMDRLIERQGKKSLYIPVGITGSPQVFDPTTNWPTEIAMRAANGLVDPRLVKVRVGLPIKSDEIADQNRSLVLGSRVAQLLPENERGVFRTISSNGNA